jgi:hypothetical protein
LVVADQKTQTALTHPQPFLNWQTNHYARSLPSSLLMTYMTDNWKNSDCPVKPVVDRHLTTQKEYDFKYIHDTVYSLAQSEHNLAPQVREALNVIEEAVDKYG